VGSPLLTWHSCCSAWKVCCRAFSLQNWRMIFTTLHPTAPHPKGDTRHSSAWHTAPKQGISEHWRMIFTTLHPTAQHRTPREKPSIAQHGIPNRSMAQLGSTRLRRRTCEGQLSLGWCTGEHPHIEYSFTRCEGILGNPWARHSLSGFYPKRGHWNPSSPAAPVTGYLSSPAPFPSQPTALPFLTYRPSLLNLPPFPSSPAPLPYCPCHAGAPLPLFPFS